MSEQISQAAAEGQTAVRLDDVDRKILFLLQQDASLSLDQIADKVGASKTPVWNRIRKLREAGVIRRQVAILDPEALGLEACFFVLIRTSEHDKDWAARFLKALRERPEVIEAHRLAGDIDYILKVQVRNARAYDRFYQSLISEVKIHNVTALLSMEEIKATSALPIPEFPK
ncbi:Lrp/AsnC family transcriptional regulator [Paracoccus homiensis]|uniref:Transcriptional regulator, AsnC family n=1 Tax=Paracoccus homiensis TaxID=364199 RepID=A0A1H9YDL1_9RHOB|nr:Lrp/AsnC family transcriptional regulator [Paracoccus homiensis]SES67016.1 transcriptional regulator, AsnC family [Paracoccus homiensis]